MARLAFLVLLGLLSSGWGDRASAVGPPASSSAKKTPAAAPPAPPAPPESPAPSEAPLPPLSPLPPAPPSLPDLRAALRRVAPQGWFGMGIACDDCTIDHDSDTGATVWEFDVPPRVQYVDPDGPAGKAGLQRGDVLLQIDGTSITSAKGGKRFGSVLPGESVRWTYERAGKRHEVTLVAAEHPDDWVDIDPEAQEEIDAALERLRDEGEQLRREHEKLRLTLRSQKDALERTMADSLSGRAYAEALEHAMADSLRRNAYADALREMEAAQRALEETSRSLRRQVRGRPSAAAPTPTPRPEPPVPTRHNLRFEGTIGGSQVEVHGSGAVVVTEDKEDEIVITTPDATIRIRKRK